MYISKIPEQLMQTIDNYYNILEQTGYYNYSSVCKILVLSFIDDLLNTNYEYLANTTRPSRYI